MSRLPLLPHIYTVCYMNPSIASSNGHPVYAWMLAIIWHFSLWYSTFDLGVATVIKCLHKWAKISLPSVPTQMLLLRHSTLYTNCNMNWTLWNYIVWWPSFCLPFRAYSKQPYPVSIWQLLKCWKTIIMCFPSDYFFLLIALVGYDLHTTQFTHFKYIMIFSILVLCNHHQKFNFITFHYSPNKPWSP